MEIPLDGTDRSTADLPAGRHRAGLRPVGLPRLGLTASERRLVLWLVDVLVLNTILLAVLVLRFGYPLSWRTLSEARIYFLLLTALWAVWASFFDCYDLPRTADASASAWSAGRAALASALCYLVVPYYAAPLPSSRLSTFLFIGLATVSVPVWRALYAWVFVQPTFQRRVLIVGAGRAGTELARILAATPHNGNPYAGSGYQAVGFVDDDPAKAGRQLEGLPVLGNRHDLRRVVDQHEVDKVVLAITNPNDVDPELLQVLLDCREQGLHLVPMAALYEQLTGRVPVWHAGGNLHVVLPLEDSATRRLFQGFKRLADLAAATVGLIAVALIAPFVAAANALWSPGPLFYRQARVGRGGQTFPMLKFRSMVPGAETECGAVWADEGDPRVTPAGRLLRKARVDELPQVWNILKGEMSLVGPRPERPEFVSNLEAQLPFYQARHAVRPGITGWAQVRYRYGSSVDDARVKLEYDLYYIKNQGMYLELSILVKTAAVMLKFTGR